MKLKVLLSIIWAGSAVLQCDDYADYAGGVYTASDPPCVYEQIVWQAAYWVNSAPGDSVSGWTKVGPCEGEVVKPCTAVAWTPKSYPTVTTVTYKGAEWTNKWYADATPPDEDSTANWVKGRQCTEEGSGSTATTSKATTTTKHTTTTVTAIPTLEPELSECETSTTTACQSVSIGTTVRPPVSTVTTEGQVVPEPENPTDPTGPNGECIWPEWRQRVYASNSLCGMGSKVYKASWYAGTSEPPPSGPWKEVATCTGTAPKATYTEEEMAEMVGDKKGLVRVLDPWTPEYPSIANSHAYEEEAREDENLRLATEALRILPLDQVEAVVPQRAENPENVKRVEKFLDSNLFEQLFPVRHKNYSYANLLKAVAAFPAYCATYTDGRDSDTICKKVLAISFAHTVQETSANWPTLTWPPSDLEHYNEGADRFMTSGAVIPVWRQGLWYLREMGHTESEGASTDGYRSCSMEGEAVLMWSMNFPCNKDRAYYGRGMKQLSWNYNYGGFSQTFYGDATKLLNEPALVADTFLNFASAIWFAVTPQSPKPSMIWVADGSWKPNAADEANGIKAGFGATINIINGGLECNKAPDTRVETRVTAYREFAKLFGLNIEGEELYCTNQKPFTADGSGACPMYWYRNAGLAHCSISAIQTPWLATRDGDYMECINYNYRGHYFLNGEKVCDYGNVPGSAWPQ